MITIIDKVKEKYNSIDIEKKAVLWTVIVIFVSISAFMLLLKFPVIISLSMIAGLALTYALYLIVLETLRKREKNK